MFFRLFTFVVFITFFIVLAYSRSDGFSPFLIQTKSSMQTFISKEEGISVLNQPFYYLARGRQAYVFESHDKKWVIKFFNQSYFATPFYMRLFGEKEINKRNLRKKFYETSYQLSFDELDDEIYCVHLGNGGDFPEIVVYDNINQNINIDLRNTSFVLQKKGKEIFDYFSDVFEKEGDEGLKKLIDSFVYALNLRLKNSIIDLDNDFQHNWGGAEGKIFQLDPGRLCKVENLSKEKELNKTCTKLRRWLLEHHPSVVPYLDTCLLNS
jgi:hypothetical protein